VKIALWGNMSKLKGRSLETERLILRPITMDDLDALAAMFADPEVMLYLPTGSPRTREATQAELEHMVWHWQEHGFGAYAVVLKETGAVMGYCELQYLHVEPYGVTEETLPDPNEVEIGYGIDKPYWNQGYTKEAAREVLKFGFERLGLERIVAGIHDENTASRRILEGLGMVETWELNFYGDEPHFVITQEQYEANKG